MANLPAMPALPVVATSSLNHSRYCCMQLTNGELFVITAPSGGGKTTLVRLLLEADDNLRLSVSHTTRAPRSGEVEGRDYFFVSQEEFRHRVDTGGYLEWAQVHDYYYGTTRTGIEDLLQSGYDVLLDIDWQGAGQLRQHYPSSTSIFILPPSLDILRDRLAGRATDSQHVVAKRLGNAVGEMRHAKEFDYVIINDQLAMALADIQAVIRSVRLRSERQQSHHAGLLQRLTVEENKDCST